MKRENQLMDPSALTESTPDHGFTNHQGLLHEYNGDMEIQHWLSKLPRYVREWLGPLEHRISTGPNAHYADYAFPKIGAEAEFKYRGGSRPVDQRQVERQNSGVIAKLWTAKDKSCIYEGPNHAMTEAAYGALSQAGIRPRRGIKGWIKHLETLISQAFPGWTYLEKWQDRSLVALDFMFSDQFPIIPSSFPHDIEDDGIRIPDIHGGYEGNTSEYDTDTYAHVCGSASGKHTERRASRRSTVIGYDAFGTRYSITPHGKITMSNTWGSAICGAVM